MNPLNVDIKFDLGKYLCSVVETLCEKLTDMKTIKAYPIHDREIKDVPVPSVLVDFHEIIPNPENDPGTGQMAVDFMMSAYCVVAASQPKAALDVRKYAMNVAAVIHNSKFYDAPSAKENGDLLFKVSAAQILSIAPRREVNDENYTYLAWGVDWQHSTYLAAQDIGALCDSLQMDADDVDSIFLGYAPDTGRDHVDDYDKVFDKKSDEEIDDILKAKGWIKDD